MFSNMGLHITKFPSGRFGYVGSIPTVLGDQVTASKAAVMGGRAFYNAAGDLAEWKFPVFDTAAAAAEFAKAKDVTAATPKE